jgi:hypothetical protein
MVMGGGRLVFRIGGCWRVSRGRLLLGRRFGRTLVGFFDVGLLVSIFLFSFVLLYF